MPAKIVVVSADLLQSASNVDEIAFCKSGQTKTTVAVCLQKGALLCYNAAMNGYDFDKTIYTTNCFRSFYGFCLLRLPYLILLAPVSFVGVLLRACRIISKETYWVILGLFIVFVPNKQRFVQKYWDKNIHRIANWYLAQRKADDVVVSASPKYIVQEACNRLGIATCIAADINPKTGLLTGNHCYAQGKVERFNAECGAPLATYYSDSMTDVPMFRLAEKGYFVQGDKITLVYQNGQPV